jgi:hypothetical protein
MAKTVRSDIPFLLSGFQRVALEGHEYDAWVNSHGAVAAVLDKGERLGVRPYEFEVIEWHGEERYDAESAEEEMAL